MAIASRYGGRSQQRHRVGFSSINGFIFLLLAYSVKTTLAQEDADSSDTSWSQWMPHAMERIFNKAQIQRQAIFERISEKQQKAMKKLFDQLDANNDGAIQFDEFQGMTLATWAAFQSLSMDTFSVQEGAMMFQEFMRLPDFLPQRLRDVAPPWLMPWFKMAQARVTSWGWLSIYIASISCFQLMLVSFEIARSSLGFYRWSMPSEPVAVSSLTKATREEVLEYDTPWRNSKYEIFKLVVMTFSGLAAIRFVFSFLSFVIAVVLINVATLREERIWRAVWLSFAKFFIFCLMGGLGFYNIHIKGKLASKDQCKLLLGNHVGTFELFALYALAFPSFVSRSSNMNLPLFNGIVLASDAILVDRDNSDSKSFTMKAIKEHVNDPGARHLMLFPEGTCNNQKTLFRFSRGAFSTGKSPVQLVLFKFPYKHFNPCYTGVAVGGHEFWDLMWRSLCQFVQHMEVVFLPPYAPTDDEVSDPTKFADHMQQVMASHLHCKLNDETYKIYREAHAEYLLTQQKQRAGRHLKRFLQEADCLRRGLRRTRTGSDTHSNTSRDGETDKDD